MIDLNTIPAAPEHLNWNWEAAPTGFDRTGTLFNISLNEYEDTIDPLHPIRLVMAYDIDRGRSDISAEVRGRFYGTDHSSDWPIFDRIFGGRDEWKDLLEEHTEEAREIMQEDEDD